MDFDTYQRNAASTATYPGVGENFVYPALGLGGEAGEVAEKVAALCDDGTSPELLAVLAKEVGDVLWYAAQLSTELGLSFSAVAEARFGVQTFSEVLERVECVDLTGATLRLVAAAGAVLERVKKVLRDQGGVMSEASVDLVQRHLGEVIARLAEVCCLLEFDMDAIAAGNTAKLADRAARDVLRGDGDLR